MSKFQEPYKVVVEIVIHFLSVLMPLIIWWVSGENIKTSKHALVWIYEKIFLTFVKLVSCEEITNTRGARRSGVGQEGEGGREGSVSAFHSVSVRRKRLPFHAAGLHLILGRGVVSWCSIKSLMRGSTFWGRGHLLDTKAGGINEEKKVWLPAHDPNWLPPCPILFPTQRFPARGCSRV